MEKEARAGGLKLRGWILNAIFALMRCAVIARFVAAMGDTPQPLLVERDKIGFMVVHAQSGGTVEAL
jgi:hypothetical protein